MSSSSTCVSNVGVTLDFVLDLERNNNIVFGAIVIIGCQFSVSCWQRDLLLPKGTNLLSSLFLANILSLDAPEIALDALVDSVSKKGQARCRLRCWQIGRTPINAALSANLQGKATVLLQRWPFLDSRARHSLFFAYKLRSKNNLMCVLVVLLDGDNKANNIYAFVAPVALAVARAY